MLVVGGGPAGCAAAVAARRLGAKVTLVERYNHLGGLSTGGLVIWIDRMSDWEGRQIITGFASEILERLPADAIAGAPQEQWGSQERRARRPLARAPERLPRRRHLVADDRPGVAEVPSRSSCSRRSARGCSCTPGSSTRSSTATSCAARSSRARRAAARSSPRSSSTPPATSTSAPAAGAPTSPTSTARAHVQHCINTAWTWAGVDLARWLAFKRANPEGYRALSWRGPRGARLPRDAARRLAQRRRRCSWARA